MSKFQLPFFLALSLHWLAGLAAAAGAALLVNGLLPEQWGLAGLAALAAGLLLTAPLLRTLWQLEQTLTRLNAGEAAARLSLRGHGALTGLVTGLNTLAEQMGQVATLREGWQAQARAAAAREERNRLARELHDSIKQQLFSLNLSVAAAQTRWEHEPEAARAALADARRNAQEAMAEMNALLQQLSPSPLEKVGLQQALRDQCEAFGYRTGAPVSAEFGAWPGDDRLPPGAQDSLFRMAQEALSNVARHSRAAHAQLYLGQRQPGGPVELEIRDDGQGFDPATAASGMGLANLRQRTQALGGTVEINSAPGRGAALRIQIPLALPADAQEDTMKPEHTFNKAFLVGLLGGLALIAALFYPLYVLVPGQYVAGWPTGSPWLGLLCQAAAALLVVGTGYAAARWVQTGSRANHLLLGALAGGVAGAICYFGLGAAAANVAGSQLILRNGLVQTDENQVIFLLVEAVRGTIQWSYSALWGAALIGAGLGAIGGVLVPPGAPADHLALRRTGRVILTAALLGSALAVCVTLGLYWLLEPAMVSAIEKSQLALAPQSAVGSISAATGTALALYVATCIGLYRLLRSESQTAEAEHLAGLPSLAYFCAAIAGIMVIQLTALLSNSSLSVNSASSVARLGAIFSAAMVVLFGLAGQAAERRAKAAGWPLLPGRLSGVVVILGAILLPVAWLWASARSDNALLIIPPVLFIAALAGLVVMWREWRKLDAAFRARQWSWLLQEYVSAILGSVTLLCLCLMPIGAHALGVLTIPINMLAVLFSAAAPVAPLTLPQLVQRLYLNEANLLLVGFIVMLVGVGIAGLITVFRRRAEPKTA